MLTSPGAPETLTSSGVSRPPRPDLRACHSDLFQGRPPWVRLRRQPTPPYVLVLRHLVSHPRLKLFALHVKGENHLGCWSSLRRMR